jgi:hypothetical protein
MPRSVALTAIRHRNTCIQTCTPRNPGGRNRSRDILADNHVLINVYTTLIVGHSPVPLIFMSDRTHLSNGAGDNQEWPVYMTIGNLSLKIRQMHPMHSVVMVALLPIQIKNRNILQNRLDRHQ